MYLFTSPRLSTIHLWHKHARIEKHRSSIVGRKNENCLMTYTVTSLSAHLSWRFRVRVGGRTLRRKRTTKPLFTFRHGHPRLWLERRVYYREITMTTWHQSPNDWLLINVFFISSASWTSFEELFSLRTNRSLFPIVNGRLIYNSRAETRITRETVELIRPRNTRAPGVPRRNPLRR